MVETTGEASHALAAMLREAVSRGGALELARDAEGARALMQLLQGLAAADPCELCTQLEALLQQETGAQALLDALSHANVPEHFRGLEQSATHVANALVRHARAAKEASSSSSSPFEETDSAVPRTVEHVSALCAARKALGCEDSLELCEASLATLSTARLCFTCEAFCELLTQDLLSSSACEQCGATRAPLDRA